ncbi:cytochrome P450 [Aspergillus affinis]|uniref:cytochrome P450 n=1 Tax=Aspergillus affinis TaxID=1070780 RepID=UPI0022FF32B2|nr:uncharacterized protein KD926_003266 [Aspergillus affinis]KAI9035564.1 hypothetical protein KD926_003266 [Aspergillus affinis]
MSTEVLPAWLQNRTIPQLGATVNYTGLAVYLVGSFFIYGTAVVVYRLYLSPIAHFPGPRLAAATEWYEFYYQLVKDGQWGRKIMDIHDEYGPIVRISPWELSIRDSGFYHQLVSFISFIVTIFVDLRTLLKDSHHLTVPHELHRHRRRHLESFFSRKSITDFESTIIWKVRVLDQRLQSLAATKTVVHVDHAFMALTGDIIAHVTCGTTPRLLEDKDFSPAWHELMHKTVLVAPLFRCFSWLNRLMQMMPSAFVERVYPKGISSTMVGKMGRDYIEKIRSQMESDTVGVTSTAPHSVFHHLLSSEIAPSEKSTARLQAESMVILIAGTFTSAHTLSMIVYHVLSDPRIEKRLREELCEVMACYPAQSPRWADLERVAYLQGCIKEALRLYGLVGNLARCSPEVALQYKQWTIPKHTPVGMSIYQMHTDPAVWADPLEFRPERWLGSYDSRMDRNYVPFTKGSRACLGSK